MLFAFSRFAVFLLALATPAAAAPVDYARDVRPILSNNCFYCHGQDPSHRKGKLRLDTPEGQRKEGVIVAGKPDESELIARILSPHDDEQMPPSDSNKTLSAEQKDTLRRWIAEGAPFAEHWAFTAPQRPAPPAAGEGWARSAIDRFVAAGHGTMNSRPLPRLRPPRWPAVLRSISPACRSPRRNSMRFWPTARPVPTSAWLTACSPARATASTWR